jgi:hypothetical protein
VLHKYQGERNVNDRTVEAPAEDRDVLARLRGNAQPGCLTGWLLVAEAADEIELLRKRLSDTSTRWIPVEERFPSEEGRYAIVYRYKNTKIRKAFIADWHGEGWGCDVSNSTITHWAPLLPLPEAP